MRLHDTELWPPPISLAPETFILAHKTLFHNDEVAPCLPTSAQETSQTSPTPKANPFRNNKWITNWVWAYPQKVDNFVLAIYRIWTCSHRFDWNKCQPPSRPKHTSSLARHSATAMNVSDHCPTTPRETPQNPPTPKGNTPPILEMSHQTAEWTSSQKVLNSALTIYWNWTFSHRCDGNKCQSPSLLNTHHRSQNTQPAQWMYAAIANKLTRKPNKTHLLQRQIPTDI